MKKSIQLIAFVVIAAALIAVGSWYASKISSDSEQSSVAQGQAAAQAQQTAMQSLGIKDDVVGTGTVAANGDTVTVNYIGTLDNGTTFDSSYARNQPFSFVLGAGNVISGWDLGVLGMKVGGKRELTIPPELGYGADGAGSTIPPNATLHFTIQLLSVSTSTSSTSGQ